MTMKDWEEKVLAAPGAPARVAVIEEELRLAVALTNLREQAGLSQRALGRLMGVSQPRVAAIERSPNVTLDVIAQYAAALGGHVEVTIVKGNDRFRVAAVPLRSTRRDVTAKRASGVVPSPGKAGKSTASRANSTGGVGTQVKRGGATAGRIAKSNLLAKGAKAHRSASKSAHPAPASR
jgi:transcriptional regulator with XRE-family HTH domain